MYSESGGWIDILDTPQAREWAKGKGYFLSEDPTSKESLEKQSKAIKAHAAKLKIAEEAKLKASEAAKAKLAPTPTPSAPSAPTPAPSVPPEGGE